VHQSMLLRPTNGGRVKAISVGTSVTFVASVHPSDPTVPRARVTFAFFHQIGTRWVVYRYRTVAVDVLGHAAYRWRFSVRGQWYVRAQAAATTANAASAWSQVERFSVR
jgi:hypothetical protein